MSQNESKTQHQQQQHTTVEELREAVDNIQITRTSERNEKRLRKFLKDGVINRLRLNKAYEPAFEGVNKFRHIRTRPDYIRRSKIIRVNINTTHVNSDFSVSPTNIVHELTHSLHHQVEYDIKIEARLGRDDKAHYYNGGFPHFDFGGKHPEAEKYMLCKDGETPGENQADSILQTRISRIDADRVKQVEVGDDSTILYPPAGRTHPTKIEHTPIDAETAQRELFREANIAWYVTARLMEEGYETAARNAWIQSNYSATNAREMLCMSCEAIHRCSSSPDRTLQLVHRHPWLFKRWVDIFDPSPQAEEILDKHGINIAEWRSPIQTR